MKKLIVLIAMVALLAGTSSAAITNPDGFEGYTPGSWSPTAADGWTNTTASATITATGGLGGTQGVNAGGHPSGGGLVWTGSDTGVSGSWGIQAFDMDFRITTGTGTNTRWHVGATGFSGSYGAFNVYASDYGSTMRMQNSEHISGTPYDTNPANYQTVTTPLPGSGVPNAASTWRDGNWHHLRVEMDFNHHAILTTDTGTAVSGTGLVRARYDANAWTPWVPMPDYRNWGDGRHEDIRFGTLDDYHNDGPDFNMDNVQWTVPEPATMVMLGLGALLLRRKR